LFFEKLRVNNKQGNCKMTEVKKESTFELVKRIVKDNLKVEDDSMITMEAGFIDDLKADSLDIVEVIMAFETEFGVEIPDADAEKILTVGDAVRYIDEHKAK